MLTRAIIKLNIQSNKHVKRDTRAGITETKSIKLFIIERRKRCNKIKCDENREM